MFISADNPIMFDMRSHFTVDTRGSLLRVFLIVLVLGLLGACGSSAPDRVAEELRETLAAYQTALREKNGRAAVELVSASTHQYYAGIRERALYAPRVTVESQPITDRIQILLVRSRIPVASLKEMNGRDLFRYYVDKGWSGGGAALARTRLDHFEFGQDVVTAVQMEGNKPSPLRWRFFRESKRWRVDLTALLPIAEQTMRAAIARTPLSETEFVMRAIESQSLSAPKEDIWEPMSPRLH